MGVNPTVVTDDKTFSKYTTNTDFLGILETGHVCGMKTVNEAIDNILLHYDWFPKQFKKYAEMLRSSNLFDLKTNQWLDSKIIDIVPKHTIDKWEKDEVEWCKSKDNRNRDDLLQYWTDLILYIQDEVNHHESDKHRWQAGDKAWACDELSDVQHKLEERYDIQLDSQFCSKKEQFIKM